MALKIPSQKELKRIIEDALDDLGCDVSYDALPKDEVLDDISDRIKSVYADTEEYALIYDDMRDS